MEYEVEEGADRETARRERERREQRRRLIQQRKRRSRRLRLIYALIRTFGPYAAGALCVIVLLASGVGFLSRTRGEGSGAGEKGQEQMVQDQRENNFAGEKASVETDFGTETGSSAGGAAAGTYTSGGGSTAPGTDASGTENSSGINGKTSYTAQATAATKQLGGQIDSGYAILLDKNSGDILAQKGADTIINPASMTKVLTVLVAAEHVEDLEDTFTITLNETDYSYVNDCSSVGFAENEVVTVRDLFYGTILPSGGDAAAALAAYVAGTREAFVELMNEKLEEMGLSDTAHMTNCVGLYDEEHYCTVYDMAMILEAALDNELCREVLSAHTYTTSATSQHPEGLLISNWFLRRIEDKDTGGEVVCGKTGYVVQSGSCAASYGRNAEGRELICVTADAGSSWKCIYDHVALYKEYLEEA